jgi:hypothetical protein
MGLEKIKNYFDPKSILDIGANVGQFYNEIKTIFRSTTNGNSFLFSRSIC